MNTRRQSAFTLIELLVVVFIIVFLSVLVLANYRSGQMQYSLSQSTQRLVSDLRKAQNMAMGGVGIKGQYCGYGIKINYNEDPTSYIFYADVSSLGCNYSDHEYDNDDHVVETVTLLRAISVQSTSPSPLDIFFQPPEPITYINASNTLGEQGTIILEAKDASLSKTIKITTAGLIQVE
jgi:prepilin-type N-terminal cleavage/methylation domain-containing protein